MTTTPKRITITEKVADSLQSLIEDGIGGTSITWLRRELRHFNPTDFVVHGAKLPNDVIVGIVARVEDINDQTEGMLHNCGISRSDVECLNDAYVNLDSFLARRFTVTREGRSKKPYGWRTGE
jgi:hypothetical protein